VLLFHPPDVPAVVAAAAAAAADKYFTLGEHPIRVAGMKVYSTAEDTCIMEMPLLWGSNAVVRT
jgi:hypothetical protein